MSCVAVDTFIAHSGLYVDCAHLSLKKSLMLRKVPTHDQLLSFIRRHYNCLFIISENNFRGCFIAYTVFSTHAFICGRLP